MIIFVENLKNMQFNTYIISLICIVAFSCNTSGNTSDEIRIEGNVKNCAPGFFLILSDDYRSQLKRQTDTAYVNEDGSYELRLKPGRSFKYKIVAGRAQFPLYLKPGKTEISFDYNDIQKSISFSNDFSEENRAFNEFRSVSPEKTAHIFFKRPVTVVKKDIHKIYDTELSFWKDKENNDLDPAFLNLMKQEALLTKTSDLVSYKAIYRWAKNQLKEPLSENEPSLPDNYYDFLNTVSIGLNDTFLYFNSKVYRDYVSSIIYTVSTGETNKYFLPEYSSKSNSSIINFFNVTIELINNKTMINYILASFLMPEIRFRRNFNDDMAQLVKRFEKYANNDSKELIAFFNKQKKQMDVVKPGSKAPDFNFNDINGKSYSMNDLKGKYIYIDVWATWCAPCKREIPYLQKI
ncbi:MAG TPA: TlpA family protein disulfide reductase [Bacteroidetes bacterium]|nr:TlpA family protein disulfide reductase [Bacteroidota bacterium]